MPPGAAPRLSVMMITGNVIERSPGRAIFERALQSVAWADELVIVDSASSDATREVAARYTERIYVHPYRNSLKQQKVIALQYVTGDWVLWVDADEVLPPALIAEIQAAVRRAEPLAYRLPRQHIFLDRALDHVGDDAPLRLWRRGVGEWGGPENDEIYVVAGPVGRMHTPLEHYSSPTLALRLEKIAFFASAHAASRPLPPVASYSLRDAWRWIFKPAAQQFYGAYWLQRGYKDGVRGLVWATLCAIAEFYTGILVWERAEADARAATAEPISHGGA